MKFAYSPRFAFITALVVKVTQDSEWVSNQPDVDLDVYATPGGVTCITFLRKTDAYQLAVSIELGAQQTLAYTHRYGAANKVSVKTSTTYAPCAEDPRLIEKIWEYVREQFDPSQPHA